MKQTADMQFMYRFKLHVSIIFLILIFSFLTISASLATDECCNYKPTVSKQAEELNDQVLQLVSKDKDCLEILTKVDQLAILTEVASLKDEILSAPKEERD